MLAVGDKAESGEVEKGHFIEVLTTELWACPSFPHGLLLVSNLLGLEWFLPLQNSALSWTWQERVTDKARNCGLKR